MKRLSYLLYVALVTFLLMEFALRILIVRKGHIDYLFGRRSYFLPPFRAPDSIPEPDTTTFHVYNVYDPQLGWSIGKLGAQPPYYSDHLGYRCAQSYYDSLLRISVLPQRDSVYDVVCLGDSFTHGDEVSFEETWPYQLARFSGLKVLNLGVGGYGIDQAILRYEMERPVTKLVILALVAGDLDRATTQIYNLTFGGLKTKPLFVFDGNDILVFNQPALRGSALRSELVLGESSSFLQRERYWPGLFHNSWFSHFVIGRTIAAVPLWKVHRQSVYRTQGHDMEYCISIMRYGQQLAKKRGAAFVVLLLENLNTFSDWDKFGNPWGILSQELTEAGIMHWYCGESIYKQFKQDPAMVINLKGVHYTKSTNREVGQFVSKQVR